MIFTEEYKVLESIAAVSSTKKKEAILRENRKLLRKIVFYALDFNKKYHIKKFPIPDAIPRGKGDKKNLFLFLDYLADKSGTNKSEARKLVEMCHGEEDLEVVRRIVNKDLRCGINLKLASKVYSKLPTKDIMLCGKAARVIVKNKKTKISSELYEFVKSCGGWENVGVSDKENGVRNKMTLVGGGVVHVSRNGLTYRNFTIFDDPIKALAKKVTEITGRTGIIFDGEVIHKDEKFQTQMTQIRRLKDADPSNFVLKIFDVPSIADLTQQHREKILSRAYRSLDDKYKKKTFLTLCKTFNDEKEFFAYYRKLTVEENREGVVLKNLQGLYENKRSNNWCKVKTFYTADLRVIRAEKGKPGKKFANTLGALVVDFNGVEVRVGTGYDEKSGQRKMFLENPPKFIEVEYKEITEDGSMFHPSFVRVRWELE